jgi:hypothetical protein
MNTYLIKELENEMSKSKEVKVLKKKTKWGLER